MSAPGYPRGMAITIGGVEVLRTQPATKRRAALKAAGSSVLPSRHEHAVAGHEDVVRSRVAVLNNRVPVHEQNLIRGAGDRCLPDQPDRPLRGYGWQPVDTGNRVEYGLTPGQRERQNLLADPLRLHDDEVVLTVGGFDI